MASRRAETVLTDRGEVRAPLIVDALGWRRVLGAGQNIQPPEARLSRGLEVHPGGRGDDLELWIDKQLIRAGYGWSFPAAGELRVGVGSFDPRDHVKAPTVALAGDLGLPPRGYQGNWIPHQLRPATEDGVFFAGDSAGHCLPLTAEGIRTAFYFGIALGRELRAVLEGRATRAEALARYHRFSAAHSRRVRGHAPSPGRRAPAVAARAGRRHARVRARARVLLGLRALPAHRAARGRAARTAPCRGYGGRAAVAALAA